MKPESTKNRDHLLENIAKEYSGIIRDLEPFDQLTTTLMFSGLLLRPELQVNCRQIEALVHLAVASCRGQRNPSIELVRSCFARVCSVNQGLSGEPPFRDIFIGQVDSPHGNFRIFEGCRQASSFYLQRILNVVETMPEDRQPFVQIRESVLSLLILSDEIAARSALPAYLMASEEPVVERPGRNDDGSLALAHLLHFSAVDLAKSGIRLESLQPFLFRTSDGQALLTQSLGRSELERQCLVLDRDGVSVLLPTAIGFAISQFVEREIREIGASKRFAAGIAEEFTRLFAETGVLNLPQFPSVQFERLADGFGGATLIPFDPGRVIGIISYIRGLESFITDRPSVIGRSPMGVEDAVKVYLGRIVADSSRIPGFRDGIVLVVACEFGATSPLNLEIRHTSWRVETISAPDLVSLSWLNQCSTESLLQIVDSQTALAREKVLIANSDGLLNLVAWSRRFGGRLVSPDLELQESDEAHRVVLVLDNAASELRREIATHWGSRRVLDCDGHWTKVRLVERSLFEEDNRRPVYASEQDVHRKKLRAVFITPARPWWIEIEQPNGAPADLVFEYWRMLHTWLRDAAPVLDAAFPSLGSGPISYLVEFTEIGGNTLRACNSDEAYNRVALSATCGSNKVYIKLCEGFEAYFGQVHNFAEQALVTAMVEGAAIVAGRPIDEEERDELVRTICPNTSVRQHHRFEARTFRHFVRSNSPNQPILIEPEDVAFSEIGLGWRVRSRDCGAEIAGRKECSEYLNSVVAVALDQVCRNLGEFDRRALIELLLNNYEAVVQDHERWGLTTQAMLAAHRDKEAALNTILEHQGRLNACLIASRILLEAASSECAELGGAVPGVLDLRRLLATTMVIFHLGGWSDAIHWGAMEPRIRINLIGEIRADQSFTRSVYDPFVRKGGVVRVQEAADTYPKAFAPAILVPSIADVFEAQFLAAWKAEFGLSLDGMRQFVDSLEDAGIPSGKSVDALPLSKLCAVMVASTGITTQEALYAFRLLSLRPRNKWREVESGFQARDWFPWRFRRRLSLLRRPFIEVSNTEDPVVLFAPGLVRDSFKAMVSWFHSGEIPSGQAQSVEMRRWIGHANNTQRIEFNRLVASRMLELGWLVRSEVRLTALMGRSFDRDYGDIDVLAWRRDSGRVLAIECKDLQYHKAMGEIAEQLSDFRGEIGKDGKPDHLKRHLRRLEVLSKYTLEVANALSLEAPIGLEGHLVFKNPVPMQFAWEHMASRVRLSLFDELDQI